MVRHVEDMQFFMSVEQLALS